MIDFYEKLVACVERNDSLLCIGLDPVPDQIPARYRAVDARPLPDLLRWQQAVIEETCDLACAYKPNIAFYEALGLAGLSLLRDTLAAIPAQIPVILDAKRGDIGSTAAAYARACFEELGVDAVTLSPYLGRDSVDPFAAYGGKGLFVLCHTSNPSAMVFQGLVVREKEARAGSPEPEGSVRPLYLQVAEEATSWSPQVGLVVGATYPEALRRVRSVAPDAWFLVPGIGAQGGEVAEAVPAGLRADGLGLIASATRGVTLADDHRAVARSLRDAINRARQKAGER